MTPEDQERILADFDYCLKEIWSKPFKQEIRREMSTIFRGSLGGGKSLTINVEQFTQHYLNCDICSEVMKTVNIGDNQTPRTGRCRAAQGPLPARPPSFRQDKMKRILVLFLFLGVGCTLPPPPATTHWGSTVYKVSVGDQLYCDDDGREAASIIAGQVCVFEGDYRDRGCVHFEENSQAMRYALKHTACPKDRTK